MNTVLDEVEFARAGDSDRIYRRVVLLITLAGAVLRFAMLATKWSRPLLLNDSIWYSGQAHVLAHGRFFPDFFGVSGAEHAPLASIVAAPASWLPHYEFFQRATMTVIGITFIPLIAVVARKVGGRKAGVLAAGIAAFYPNIWMSDALVMSESIALVLIAVVLIVALRYKDRLDMPSALLTGVAIGVAGHARSEVLIFAPILAFIGVTALPLWSWLKGALVLLGATLLVVLPWVTFNLTRFDAPVLMSTNEGTTFLGANCPETYAGPALGGWTITCLFDPVERPGEDPSERSVRQRREAINYAREHLGRVPKVVTARFLRMLDLYGLDDLVRADVGEERPRGAVWAGMVSWWVLAPIAAIGVWNTRRRAGIVLFAPIICVLVTAVVFYGSHRLRSPVEPVVVSGAALFLAAWPPLQPTFERLTRRAR